VEGLMAKTEPLGFCSEVSPNGLLAKTWRAKCLVSVGIPLILIIIVIPIYIYMYIYIVESPELLSSTRVLKCFEH
jgi:hypothetical protein